MQKKKQKSCSRNLCVRACKISCVLSIRAFFLCSKPFNIYICPHCVLNAVDFFCFYFHFFLPSPCSRDSVQLEIWSGACAWKISCQGEWFGKLLPSCYPFRSNLTKFRQNFFSCHTALMRVFGMFFTLTWTKNIQVCSAGLLSVHYQLTGVLFPVYAAGYEPIHNTHPKYSQLRDRRLYLSRTGEDWSAANLVRCNWFLFGMAALIKCFVLDDAINTLSIITVITKLRSQSLLIKFMIDERH
jgi:hypothetical protein